MPPTRQHQLLPVSPTLSSSFFEFFVFSEKKKKKAHEILFSTRKERIIAKHEDTKFTLHHGIPNSNTLLVRLDTRNTLGSHMGGGGIFLEEGSDDEKW